LPPPDTHSLREETAGRVWLALSIGALVAWTALVHAHPPRFFVLASAFCAVWLGLSWKALGPRRRELPRMTGADLAWSVAHAGGLYVGARAFLWAFCGGFTEALCGPLTAVYARFGEGGLGEAVALAAVIAPAEEFLWRGVVQGALRPRLGRVGCVVVASVLSSAVLLAFGEPLLALAALPTSLAWGGLAEWRRSLGAAWASHALWDVLIVVLAPAA